jgi:hypothetical protein
MLPWLAQAQPARSKPSVQFLVCGISGATILPLDFYAHRFRRDQAIERLNLLVTRRL